MRAEGGEPQLGDDRPLLHLPLRGHEGLRNGLREGLRPHGTVRAAART